MQAYPISDRPVLSPALPAKGADHSAQAPEVAPIHGWVLSEMREQAERRGEAIRARSEWIDARKREMWERMDRLRDLIGSSTVDAADASTAPAAVERHDDDRLVGADVPPVPASSLSERTATTLQSLTEQIEILLGIGTGRARRAAEDGTPAPEPAVESGDLAGQAG